MSYACLMGENFDESRYTADQEGMETQGDDLFRFGPGYAVADHLNKFR